jgi:hypothetical protein
MKKSAKAGVAKAVAASAAAIRVVFIALPLWSFSVAPLGALSV